MLSRKNIIRISILLGILSWISLLLIELIRLFSNINNIPSGIADFVPQIIQIVLFFFTFQVFKYFLKETESINILDLLWRVFVTGLVATVISLFIRFFMDFLSGSRLMENPLMISFFYHINMGLLTIFLLSTFVVWKKLILYQKSKLLIKLWRLFEYSLLISLFLIFLNYEVLDPLFNVILALLVILGIILSANLKWVAYLNFKQKWKSILLIVLVILYLWYFLMNQYWFGSIYDSVIQLSSNVSAYALFAFIFIYAVFSLLVVLFNLPTSSVFEQKLEEVINFQRLSQSAQTGQNEDQVYDILLESSVSAVMANAAWLETQSENKVELKLLTYKISREEIKQVKSQFDQIKLNALHEEAHRNLKSAKYLSKLKNTSYNSVLAFPLLVQNHQIGSLVLLKDVLDGFNKEMIEIIHTFVNQACITIENFRLMSEAIVNERYKEELKIAKRVQRSLLPDRLEHNDDFEIAAFSKAADEVGGDYYDTFRIDHNRVAIIIGDVSGKGTSAAFNMSQMKGVFHSLVQLDLSPIDFLSHANQALSRCLEKTSFITVSLLIIDHDLKTIQFARAGHCPTLIYQKLENKTYMYKSKGLGLGILRNNNFASYIEVNQLHYQPGDVIFLYTDGITEAKNSQSDFYGYERLEKFLHIHANKSAKAIQADLLRELYTFCDRKPPEDDFTSLIIKFREKQT
ncbi:MAG: GAF domain-containing SpoIIE family protein phosphatase [Candidatus Cyclobacteriaceae bacterium M3_2C_046]